MRRQLDITTDSSQIARLWALRILVNVKQRELSLHAISNQALVRELGLGEFAEDNDSFEFDTKKMALQLRKLHRRAEQRAHETGTPAALAGNVARLAAMAGLNLIDCRLLEFAVLLHAEPVLNEAAECLDGLSTAQVHKALSSILDIPEPDIRASLGRDGMLAHSGLLSVEHDNSGLVSKLELISGDFSARAMVADMQPADLLRGVVDPASPAELDLIDYPHLAASLEILLPYLRCAKASSRKGVNVFLYGPPGTGKTQLAKVVAAGIGCELFEVASGDSSGDVQGGIKRMNALRAAQCFLGKGQSLILFDEAEDVFENGQEFWRRSPAQANKGWMNRMLENNGAPTLWLSNSIEGLDPAFVRRFDMMIEVPVPPRGQRERTNRSICGDLVDEATLSRISDCEALTPGVVARATSVVRAISIDMNRQQASAATERLIDNTLAVQGHQRLRAGDAASLPDTYDPAFIHTDVDIASTAEGLAASRTGRLCLYGPPGTGKTAYARWLARELGMPLLVRRASDLLSMWLGQAEKNIARAFRQAEQEDALLLIDEVDSFLQDRRSAQRSWEVSQVNEMLTQMESFTGIFVASTNLMNGLDQAALRRFDLKVKFDYMKPKQAAELVRRHCDKLGLAMPSAAEELSSQRLFHITPGDFAVVMRQQRFRPVANTAALIAALHAECALKESARPRMGFVH